MHNVDLGSWSPAIRSVFNGQPFFRYENQAGEDWYSTVAHSPERPLGLAVGLTEDDIVISISDDLDQMDPGGKRIVVLPDFSQEIAARQAVLGKRFDFVAGEFVDPPAVAPRSVTRAQALIALHRRGYLTLVQTAVANYPFDVKLWFDNALRWERDNVYVWGFSTEILTHLELLPAENTVEENDQIISDWRDELFTYASTLAA